MADTNNIAAFNSGTILGAVGLNEVGLLEIGFRDFYGDECRVRESSLPDDDAIWLGLVGAPQSMLLTRDHIAALLPVLQHFAETGCLPSTSVARRA